MPLRSGALGWRGDEGHEAASSRVGWGLGTLISDRKHSTGAGEWWRGRQFAPGGGLRNVILAASIYFRVMMEITPAKHQIETRTSAAAQLEGLP